MGFEITFNYFEKKEDSLDFDKDESNKKNRTVLIGSPSDSIPIERVVATILKEYTKSNIWIESIEINEWIKKPMKYAETKNGGVKINGKVYNLGLNEIMKWAIPDSQPVAQPSQALPQQILNNQQSVNQGGKIWPHEVDTNRTSYDSQPQVRNTLLEQRTYASTRDEAYPEIPIEQNIKPQSKLSNSGLQFAIRSEICDPPPELSRDTLRFKITPGRKYQILEEVMSKNGRDYLYKVRNDEGREILVGWHYFRQQQLVQQDVSYYDQNGNLCTTTTYVDQVNSNNNERKPRLMYEQPENTVYRQPAMVQQPVGIDDMMAKMDAAIQRRSSQRPTAIRR